MSLPYDRRSDLFSDWLESYVAGTSTPGQELDADPELRSLRAATDQFHGLSERWAQDAMVSSSPASSWEDIMTSHSPSLPQHSSVFGTNERATPRSGRWETWNRFVSGALIVALVMAIGAGAWRVADNHGSAPGTEPPTAGVASLGQTASEATPDQPSASNQSGPVTTPIQDLPGIQSTVLRDYVPKDQQPGIPDLIAIGVTVYQFDTSENATAAYDPIVSNYTADFETSVSLNPGYSMATEKLSGIGERANLVRLNFAVEMGYQVQEYTLTLHEAYVFAVMTVTGGPLDDVSVTPPAIAEATAAAKDLALAVIADGQPSLEEPRFYADGTSTGGDWGFMPLAGDPLLLGMQPWMDQQLYPTDPNAVLSEEEFPPDAQSLTGIVGAIYRDYAPADMFIGSQSISMDNATPMTETELASIRYSTITVFVYQLESEKDAAVAHDRLSRGLLGSIANVNGGDGQEVLLSETITGIGDLATRSRITITSEGMGWINQTTFQSITVQKGEFVFVISSRNGLGPVETLPAANPDQSDPMLELATQMVANGQLSPDEPVYAEDGTSTGGLWGFMPAEGDPLLMGLVPWMDQVMYPVPER